MFTGIIDHCGKILERQDFPASSRFNVETRFTDLELGESVAVDGCCLTVAELPQGGIVSFDISPETLKLTRANSWKIGTAVNLERALRLSDRLGGHMVSGHIDQVGTLVAKDWMDGYLRFEVGGISPELAKYVTKKGSITINGVSLTVNNIQADRIEVMLIPHTLERTNLKEVNVADKVNLEVDWMAKLIVKRVEEIHEASVSS